MTGRQRVGGLILDELYRQAAASEASTGKDFAVRVRAGGHVYVEGAIDLAAIVDALLAAAPPPPLVVQAGLWKPIDERVEQLMDFISDTMVEADVDQPAGSGAGYSITYDDAAIRAKVIEIFAQPNPPGERP